MTSTDTTKIFTDVFDPLFKKEYKMTNNQEWIEEFDNQFCPCVIKDSSKGKGHNVKYPEDYEIKKDDILPYTSPVDLKDFIQSLLDQAVARERKRIAEVIKAKKEPFSLNDEYMSNENYVRSMFADDLINSIREEK